MQEFEAFVYSPNKGNGTSGHIAGNGAFQEGVTLTAPDITSDPDGDAVDPDYAYQWFKDGTAIADATEATYAVPLTGAGTYKVAITYTDGLGFQATVESPEQVVSIFNNGNEPSTALDLSKTSFAENIASGSTVATLSTTDQDIGDTHTYALIAGDGDADNSAFTIEGDQLKIIESPDFESKMSYSIRLETKDSGGLTLEKEVALAVNDVNEEPADLSVSTSTVDENNSDGAAVATLSTSDPDSGDTHAYALVSGDGDADNSAFTIEGDQLKIINSPDFEGKSSYSIRLQTKDSGGLILEKEVTLEVNDLNDSPENFWISSSTFSNNVAGGTAVATLSTDDQDAENTHSYAFVSGFGDVDNEAFTIEGDQLKIIDSPYLEGKSSYSVRLQTKDSGGLTLEKSFALSVQELEEVREWTQLLGSSSADRGRSVSTAADGSVYIAGTTNGNLDGQINRGGSDVFLSKFDSDGFKEWIRLLGSSSDEWVYSVSTSADGSVYITGETSGNLDGQINKGYDDFSLVSIPVMVQKCGRKRLARFLENMGIQLALLLMVQFMSLVKLEEILTDKSITVSWTPS